MKHPDVPAANFTISDNAKRGIEIMRQRFDSHSPDPAAVATIGWTLHMPYSGEEFERVAVTFYGRSQYDEVAPAIQTVSGMEVVFLPVAKDYVKFEGKVLDFADDGGFFLREP